MRVVPVESGHGRDRVAACVWAQRKSTSNSGKLAKRNLSAQHISALRRVTLHPQPSVSESKPTSRHCPLRSDRQLQGTKASAPDPEAGSKPALRMPRSPTSSFPLRAVAWAEGLFQLGMSSVWGVCWGGWWLSIWPHSLLGEHELEHGPSQRCRGSLSEEGLDPCPTLSIDKRVLAADGRERATVGHKLFLDW